MDGRVGMGKVGCGSTSGLDFLLGIFVEETQKTTPKDDL